jgi:hypothetical protein
MKVKFQIPQTLNSITLGQYQNFQKVLKDNEGAEESSFVGMKMLEIFCNADFEKIRNVDLGVFDVALNKLKEVLEMKPSMSKKIVVDDTEYGFIPDLENITLGEYVDLEKYMADPMTFHKAMAVLYRPIKMKVKDTYLIEDYIGTEDRGEIMKEAGLSDTLGAMLFFWTLGSELVNDILASLKEEGLKTTNTENDHSSHSDGDGINQSYILQMETLLKSIESQNYLFTNVCLN